MRRNIPVGGQHRTGRQGVRRITRLRSTRLLPWRWLTPELSRPARRVRLALGLNGLFGIYLSLVLSNATTSPSFAPSGHRTARSGFCVHQYRSTGAEIIGHDALEVVHASSGCVLNLYRPHSAACVFACRLQCRLRLMPYRQPSRHRRLACVAGVLPRGADAATTSAPGERYATRV